MSTETIRRFRDGEKGGGGGKGYGGDSSSYRECALVLLMLAVGILKTGNCRNFVSGHGVVPVI